MDDDVSVGGKDESDGGTTAEVAPDAQRNAETRAFMRALEVRHELRVAVTMNGGVSLAVYIGGAAHELNELTNDEGPYASLVKHVGYDTSPRIDVITGTSAGGINATALALAQANSHDTDLSLLKLLWIEHGQIGALLRQPFREGPPSLLKGDEYFYPRISSALQRLTATYGRSETDVDLAITTTLLSPVLLKKPDDLGTSTVQPQHAGLFEFRGKRPPEDVADLNLVKHQVHDDFSEKEIEKTVSALALAARASAGFPVAFEPTFVPVNHDEAMSDRPDMGPYADWVGPDHESNGDDQSRFAIDGGVLANTPTKPALSGIRRHKANDQLVRRALILVHPHATPANTADSRPDMVSAPPSLTSTIGGVLRASSSTGSRTYVEEIEQHNEQALRWRDGRRASMKEIPQWPQLEEFIAEGQPSWRLFHSLRTQRGAYVMAHQIRRTTAVPLESIVRQAREVLDKYIRTELPELPFLPSKPPDAENLPEGEWRWGLDFALGATQLACDLLRDVISTTPYDWQQLAPATSRAALPEFLEQAKVAWKSAVNAGVFLEDIGSEEEHSARRRAAKREKYDENRATRRRDVKSEEWDDASDPEALRFRLRSNIRLYRIRMGPTLAGDGTTTRSDGATVDVIMRRLVCEPLCGVLTTLATILPAETSHGRTGTLLGENPLQGADTTVEVLRRLLSVEVLAYLLAEDSSTDSTAPSTPVEFYQLSAQVQQHFASDFSPDDKLAGMSLNRFGAFLKRSWRANDWIWGRLDATKIIMLILLSPDNIRGMSHGRTVGPEAIVDTVCTKHLPPDGLGISELVAQEPALQQLRARAIDEVRAAIDEELDRPLTAFSSLAAYGIQIAVGATEVPWLATAVIHDQVDGAAGARSSALLARFNAIQKTPQDRNSVRQAYEYLQLFVEAGIGQESVEDELPGDLAIRTAARAAAVTATMITSERSGLVVVKPVSRIVRGAVAVPYWAVTGLSHRGPLARVIAATTLAFGVSLVALSLIAPLSAPLNALVPTIGVGSIATIFVYAALRSRSIVHGAALLGLFIPLVGLAANRTWGNATNSPPAAPADPKAFHLSIPDGLLAISCVLFLVLAVVLAANINAPVKSPLAQILFIAQRLKRAAVWDVIRRAWTLTNIGLVLGGVTLTAIAVWGCFHLWWHDGALRHRWTPQGGWPVDRLPSDWVAAHGTTAAWIEIGVTALPFILIMAHGWYVGRSKSIRLRPRRVTATSNPKVGDATTGTTTNTAPANLLVDPAGLSMAWSAAYGILYLLLAVGVLAVYGLDPAPAVLAAATVAYALGVGFSVVAVHVIPLKRERRLVRKLALVLPIRLETLSGQLFDDEVIKALKRIGDDSQYLVTTKGEVDTLSTHGEKVARRAIREQKRPSIAAMLTAEPVDEPPVTTRTTGPVASAPPAAAQVSPS